jgi:hypothetical protein
MEGFKMDELRYPEKTKQVVCHNREGVYHFVTVEPNQVCTTGQPIMRVFDTKEEISIYTKDLNLTEKNKTDFDEFATGDYIEY